MNTCAFVGLLINKLQNVRCNDRDKDMSSLLVRVLVNTK